MLVNVAISSAEAPGSRCRACATWVPLALATDRRPRAAHETHAPSERWTRSLPKKASDGISQPTNAFVRAKSPGHHKPGILLPWPDGCGKQTRSHRRDSRTGSSGTAAIVHQSHIENQPAGRRPTRASAALSESWPTPERAHPCRHVRVRRSLHPDGQSRAVRGHHLHHRITSRRRLAQGCEWRRAAQLDEIRAADGRGARACSTDHAR